MSSHPQFDHCALCREVIDVFAVGMCDHPVCYKCSTRMRVLSDQLYCAICRTNLTKVIFTENRRQFSAISTNTFPVFRKLNIYFENRDLQDLFYSLLEHQCSMCADVKPFRSFALLQNHMRREHNLNYCDLCLENVTVFTLERKCYDRKKLAEHRRQGDEDDKSHKGHPLCQFCDVRFFDNDALVLHLRKQHYFCHFCEADGVTNEFFEEYNYLQSHFDDQHYLCVEGECARTQFTNAFRTQIDLRAHKASEHSKNLTKAAAKQARIIDIDISYSGGPSGNSDYSSRGSRGRGGRGRGRALAPSNDRGVITGEDYEEIQQDRDRKSLRRQRQEKREEIQAAQAISASLAEVQSKGHVNVLDPALAQSATAAAPQEPQSSQASKFQRRSEDFPSLDGRMKNLSDDQLQGNAGSMAKQLALANRFSVQEGGLGARDFPSLEGDKRPPAFRSAKKTKVSTAWSGPSATPAPVVKPQPPRPAPLQVLQPKPVATPANPTWRAIGASSAPPPPQRNPPPPSSKQVPKKKVNPASLSDFPSLSSIGNHLSNISSNPSSANTSPALKKKPPPQKVEKTAKTQAYTVEEEFVFPKKTAPKAEVNPKSKNKKKKKDAQVVEAPKSESDRNRGKSTDQDSKSIVDAKFKSSPKNRPTLNGEDVKAGDNPKLKKDKENESKDDFPSLGQPKRKTPAAPKSESDHSRPKSTDHTNATYADHSQSSVDTKLTSKTSPKNQPTLNGDLAKPSDNPKLKKDKENLSMDDFPSLGQPKRKPPGFMDEPLSSRNQNNMKTSWGADADKSDTATKQNGAINLRLGDISSMLASSSPSSDSTVTPPPPGFNSKPKSLPPGFPSVPPGFSAPTVSFTYSQPANFQARNQKLIEDIRAMTCDVDFQEFRTSSGDFRKDRLEAKDYLEQCVRVLGGGENFRKVIGELLVLLPDIDKQKELMRVYKQHLQCKTKRKKWGGDLAFQPCAQCQQVLSPADYNEHLSGHDMNADFPALS